MKTGTIIAALIAVALVALGVYMIDIDVTDSGELPEVSVEEGEMPEVNAETGDVDVGTEDVTVEVPTVDVESPEEENTGG